MKYIKIVLFALLTTLTLNAEVAYNEQILTSNGGDGVAISGEWAFVGDHDNCKVTIYKLNYATMEWGDGTDANIPFQTLGNNCNSAGFRGFGASVSQSGNWLVVGAPEGSNPQLYGAFHVYEYVQANAQWEAKTGKKGYQGDAAGALDHGEFGASVSMRDNGGTSKLLLVGAPTDGANKNNRAGKAYVFTLDESNGGTVTKVGEFTGENAGDNFGLSVTSDGTRFLIGAPQYDAPGATDAGKAYLYSTINSTTADKTYVGVQAGAERGKELSLSSTKYMLLSGNIATAYDGTQALPSVPIKNVGSTNGGDVSQSAGVVAVARKGSDVLIYPNIDDSSATPITIAKNQTNFGEDINLYKDQLIVNGDVSNEAYVYSFPCGMKPTHLVANEWAMVSVPCNVSSANIVDLFGDDMGAGNDTLCTTSDSAEACNWAMYKDGPHYTGSSNDNVIMTASDPMELGKGYWIIADHNVTLQVDDNVQAGRTSITRMAPGNDPKYVGSYDAPLPDLVAGDEKKVMMGNPFPRAFKWTNLQIGGTSFVPLLNNSFYNDTGYVYDNTQSGQPYRAITATGTPGIADEIKPYEAFWLKDLGANTVSGLKLALPFEK